MSSIWEKIESAIECNRPCVLATVIGVKGSTPRGGSTKMLVYDDGESYSTIGGGAFEHEIKRLARLVLIDGFPRRVALNLSKDLGMCCGGMMEVFLEPIKMKKHLLIYGAGHVGTALAQMAIPLGFEVVVIDERTEWLDSENMPHAASKRLSCPLKAVDSLPFTEHSYHFITTHSHALDWDILLKVYNRPVKWLGMIGSKAKKNRFMKRFELAEKSLESLQHLHTPAGLDINAKTPHEIAVSILAQMISIKNSK